MTTAYFSKITPHMSWNKLISNITTQKENNRTPLPYSIVAKIVISPLEFSRLSSNLHVPNRCYAPYASLSITSKSGIWNCLLIMSSNDDRKLLLFTAGNLYPLYASVINL